MSQVSRRFLNKNTQERIFKLFVSSIVLVRTNESAITLIEDLFTPTEKVMLSKRFSIAFMLLEGYGYDSIRDTLKVSRSTVGTVATWLKTKGKGIRTIRERIKQDEALKKIWEDIKEGIVDIFASSPGANWKESKKSLHQYKKSIEKPF